MRQSLSPRRGELGYNIGGRKESTNGREEELESQNLFDRVKNLSNGKGVKNFR
jgi:hypothetical protein